MAHPRLTELLGAAAAEQGVGRGYLQSGRGDQRGLRCVLQAMRPVTSEPLPLQHGDCLHSRHGGRGASHAAGEMASPDGRSAGHGGALTYVFLISEPLSSVHRIHIYIYIMDPQLS